MVNACGYRDSEKPKPASDSGDEPMPVKPFAGSIPAPPTKISVYVLSNSNTRPGYFSRGTFNPKFENMSETKPKIYDPSGERSDQWRKIEELLNKTPPKREIKARGRVQYIPISILEDKLDKVFGEMNWQVCNMNFQVIFNEIAVSLTLKVKHPVTKEWIERVGAGAAQIRCHKLSDHKRAVNQKAEEAGAPAPFPTIDASRKIQNAIEMDLPHAKANAMKNAIQGLGKFFGRDIRRAEDEKGYYTDTMLNNEAKEKLKNAFYELESSTTIEELDEVEKAHSAYNNRADWVDAVTRKREELEGKKPIN